MRRSVLPLLLSGLLLLGGCASGGQKAAPSSTQQEEESTAGQAGTPSFGASQDESAGSAQDGLCERLSAAANDFINGEDFVPWQYNLGLGDFDGDGAPELIVGSYGNFSGTHTLLRLTDDGFEVAGDYEVPNGNYAFYPSASNGGVILSGEGGHGMEEMTLDCALRLLPQPDEEGRLLDVWQRTYTRTKGEDAAPGSACRVTHNGEELAACQSPQDPEAAAYEAQFVHGDTSAPVVMEEEAYFAGTEDNGEILLPVPKAELETRIAALLKAARAMTENDR